MDAFIASARNDLDLSDTQDKLDYLGKNRISSPIIDRVEFRLQTNDFDLVPESYRLRITPANPIEFTRNRQYQESTLNSLHEDLQFSMNNALKIRYKLLINFLFYRERLRVINEEISLLNDKLKVIRSEGDFDELDAASMVDAEREITDKKIEKAEIESRIKKAELTIRGLYDYQGTIDINTDHLIGVTILNSLIIEICSSSDSVNIYLSREKSKYELKEVKYRVDLAKSVRNLGFAEAQYRPFRNDPFSNQFGFQIGLRLPIFNEDKADNQRSYLNLIENKNEISKTEKWLANEKQLALINAMSSISKYEIINSELEQLFPGNNLDIYKKNVVKSPEKFLEIRDTQLKMLKTKIENLEDVYNDYIDFLDVYGKLSESPLKDYLSPSLNEI